MESLQSLFEETNIELDELDTSLKSLRDNAEEMRRIQSRFFAAYESKFGRNVRKVSKRISWDDIERLMTAMRSVASVPEKKTFLGLGGLKREEYETQTDRLNLIISNLEMVENDFLQKKENVLDNLKKGLEKQVKDRAKYCKNAHSIPDENLEINEMLLSDTFVCVDRFMPRYRTDVKSYIGTLQTNGILVDDNCLFMNQTNWGKLLDSGVVYHFKSDGYEHRVQEDSLKAVYASIRLLLLNLLNYGRYGNYEITLFSPVQAGIWLNEMQDIRELSLRGMKTRRKVLDDENNIKTLRIARSRNEYTAEMERVEQMILKTGEALSGNLNFIDYNASTDMKLPLRVLIFDDIAAHDADSIRKIIKNRKRCGIVLIFIVGDCLEEKDNKYNSIKRDIEECIQCEYNGLELEYLNAMENQIDYASFVREFVENNGVKKELDTSFEGWFGADFEYGTMCSTIMVQGGGAEGRITVPFAVDEEGDLVSFEIGSSKNIHGLISGITRSGKSTTLHMIINSIAMNYRPDDVEIWLTDYKLMEFAFYERYKYPHIKFIGLQKNEEFSFCLLDLLYSEHERRAQLFKDKGAKNIDDYRVKFGMDKMPRIFMVIDEFHVMAQQAHENPVYKEKLENLLSEAGASGIVCLFSDQRISVGLNGLTDKARDQMALRLAMRNYPEEIKLMLGSLPDEDPESLERGKVYLQSIEWEKGEKKTVLKKCSVIYLPEEQMKNVSEKLRNLYGDADDCRIVDSNHRYKLDWNLAGKSEERVRATDKRDISFLHLGIPSNFDPCFSVSVVRNFGDNVISLSDNYEIQARNVINIIKSILHIDGGEVYVMADENDTVYINCADYLETMSAEQNNLHICPYMVDVCSNVEKLYLEMSRRRRERNKTAVMVIWLGLESMFHEFNYYDVKKIDERKVPADKGTSSKTDSISRDLDSIASQLEEMSRMFDIDLGADVDKDEVKDKGHQVAGGEDIIEEDDVFDAREYIIKLVEEGAKQGIFQSVMISSILSLKTMKGVKIENFRHKMSSYISKEDCGEFFGTSRFWFSMDPKEPEQMAYYDGKSARFFIPFLG